MSKTTKHNYKPVTVLNIIVVRTANLYISFSVKSKQRRDMPTVKSCKFVITELWFLKTSVCLAACVCTKSGLVEVTRSSRCPVVVVNSFVVRRLLLKRKLLCKKTVSVGRANPRFVTKFKAVIFCLKIQWFTGWLKVRKYLKRHEAFQTLKSQSLDSRVSLLTRVSMFRKIKRRVL